MQLFVLFIGSNTPHVWSVTRSSSGVQESACAARCRIQLFLILSFCLSRAVFVQSFVGPGLVCDRTPIQDPQNLAQIQHVTNKNRIKNNWIRHLAAHTVSWVPDDERVTIETCRVYHEIKSIKIYISLVFIWSRYHRSSIRTAEIINSIS